MSQMPDEKMRAAIRTGYRVGLPTKDIAEICGTTSASVRVIVHRMKLKHHSHRGVGRPLRTKASPAQLAEFWTILKEDEA